MKVLEIILKLLFLVGAIVLFVSTALIGTSFMTAFLVLALILGLVLMFNRHSSYGAWDLKPRNLRLRRIEGVLLVLFAIVFLIHGH